MCIRDRKSTGGPEPSPEGWGKSIGEGRRAQGALSSVYRTHHRRCECASFYLFVSKGACYVITRKECAQGNQQGQESSNYQPCRCANVELARNKNHPPGVMVLRTAFPRAERTFVWPCRPVWLCPPSASSHSTFPQCRGWMPHGRGKAGQDWWHG